MDTLSRRALFRRAGTAAAVAGVVTAAGGIASVLPANPASATTYTGDIEGQIQDQGGEVFNITAYGATGDTIRGTNGSIASGSTSFSSSSASFLSGDAGKVITVQGAGTSGAVLSTTISTYVNSTTVILAHSAGTSVTAADFTYGTDDTAAIVAAISAAQSASFCGKLLAPPGIYSFLAGSNSGNAIVFGNGGTEGYGGMLGYGGKPASGSVSGNTVFLCCDANAGLVFNSFATYEGFMVDGNNIATSPLQQGQLAANIVSKGGAYCTFIDVWAVRSAGVGWQLYGSQNDTFYHCGALDNATDGVYLDAGAGGCDFWYFHEANSGRYGVHGDTAHQGLPIYSFSLYTGNMRFFGGSFVTAADGTSGISKVYLRGGQDWRFIGANIVGDNLLGPTVDLSQGALACYNHDFTGCTISATPGGTNPGQACIQISSGPFNDDPYTFVKTDGVNFVAGDNSVYIEATGEYLYSAIGWVYDGTTYGPYSGSTTAIDPLLGGRTGAWQGPVTLDTHWSGSVYYRVNSDGLVELRGSATCSTASGGNMFTLPKGYNAGGSGATLNIPVYLSSPVSAPGTITVSDTGVVACDPGKASATVYLDGIMFSVD